MIRLQGRLRSWQFAQLDGDRLLRAGTDELEADAAVRRHHGNRNAQLVTICDPPSVDFEDDDSPFDVRLLRRAAGADIAYQRAARFATAKRLGDGGSNVLGNDSQVRPIDFPFADDLFHHVARQIRGDGKTDALI